MDAQLKAKWVEALRSGKYQQVRGTLREGKRGFCCLGVLADIQGCSWAGHGIPEIEGISVINRTIPGHLQEVHAGALAIDDQRTLAAMNDSGVPFTEIADHIEGHL